MGEDLFFSRFWGERAFIRFDSKVVVSMCVFSSLLHNFKLFITSRYLFVMGMLYFASAQTNTIQMHIVLSWERDREWESVGLDCTTPTITEMLTVSWWQHQPFSRLNLWHAIKILCLHSISNRNAHSYLHSQCSFQCIYNKILCTLWTLLSHFMVITLEFLFLFLLSLALFRFSNEHHNFCSSQFPSKCRFLSVSLTQWKCYVLFFPIPLQVTKLHCEN